MKKFKFDLSDIPLDMYFKNGGLRNDDESSKISITETSAPSSTSEEQSIALNRNKNYM